MFALAKETGWSEDSILDMPIGRAWSYQHSLYRAYDLETYYRTTNDEKMELYALFDKINRE